MKAIIIYDTRFGNTEKIANSLAIGLRQTGIEVGVTDIKVCNPDKLIEYDLLSIGAPTEYLSASKPMKQFLERLDNLDLKGKYGFAFDTKLDSRLSGSASKFIEKTLRKKGLIIVRLHASAIVYSQKKTDHTEHTLLKEGMQALFESIGNDVGKQFQKLNSQKVDAL
jgi:menaquinone-dependent protoporphyrinogen IX oxidase